MIMVIEWLENIINKFMEVFAKDNKNELTIIIKDLELLKKIDDLMPHYKQKNRIDMVVFAIKALEYFKSLK